MITYNHRNLVKHGISNVDVDEVLNDSLTIWIDLGVSRHGNDRLMFIGFTKTGRILEVGVELIGDDEYVFHAMDAGEHYIKEFNNAQ